MLKIFTRRNGGRAFTPAPDMMARLTPDERKELETWVSAVNGCWDDLQTVLGVAVVDPKISIILEYNASRAEARAAASTHAPEKPPGQRAAKRPDRLFLVSP